MTYAMTTPQTETKLRSDERSDDRPYVIIANPISAERSHMRHTLLPHLLEVSAANARHQDHVALFSIDKVYLLLGNGPLPEEPRRLAIVMTGAREPESWKKGDRTALDFYDMKGVVESFLNGVNIRETGYEPMEHPTYYPGRTARLVIGNRQDVGIFGELHPLVRERYDFPDLPVLAAEFDFEALLAAAPEASRISELPRFPAVMEDIALVVDEQLPAEKVRATIMAAGSGTPLVSAQVFDVFKGSQIGAGKKSLAYKLTYQADRTLTDAEVAKIRERIVKRLGEELKVVLRG
jgi:phenylalanyl-tRNA synthetase beta chain